MTEENKTTVKEDDPIQSEAFRKAVRDLEAAGELSPIEGERLLDKTLTKLRGKSRLSP